MEPFNFQAPTRIRFGIDTAGSVAEIVKDLGGKKTLIVTDANLIKAGVLKTILDAFGDRGAPETVIFDKVPPDSDLECVTQATDLARQSGCNSIVGVGGGSVMDTAKAVNIGLTYGGDIMEYQGINT
ncbi:MAG TPA: iron-containing alcohol dehydrogenase, partial [Candidatus Obscuribacterales bacterium]